ncbi:DMT family transporter [Bombilactobacillus bombi]|uniref:DMT family transporter n=1 Tax=Bombilactobacillus bombi TaxID=1303590 RepID=UPI0028707658|nr:multidrug efflux SMR transporter [Bombilactobacillus bombi]
MLRLFQFHLRRLKMKGYLYLTVAIIGEIVGTNFLKATNNFHSLIPSLVCICSYCVCFYSLTLALDSIPLNIAYALWGGNWYYLNYCYFVFYLERTFECSYFNRFNPNYSGNRSSRILSFIKES